LRRVLRADPSWLARFGAAQALARFPSDAAARDLAKVRASDPSWRVRRQAAVSLAEIGRSEEPASPAAIE
jgi:HEAT repeat protein